MNAKEKQKEFVKVYLKPTLKKSGYRTSGLTWWKDKGNFFNVINLQNYSWNTKDSVDFRFNIGIALKVNLKDPQKKKVTYYDLTTYIDEGVFLPNREKRKYGDNQGYSISDKTELSEFIEELKIDFEKYILPAIEQTKTLSDCVTFYDQFPFWGERLKKVIDENKLDHI